MKICAVPNFTLVHFSSLKIVLELHVFSQNFKYKLFKSAFVFQNEVQMALVRGPARVRWNKSTNFNFTFRN